MDRIYRIGSFNLHNIGESSIKNERDLSKIAAIIKDNQFDVVALQEVLKEGMAFTDSDTASRYQKESILRCLGPEHWGFEWAYSGDTSPRHEGYAFLWNKDRLRLSTAEVTNKYGTQYTRTYVPRMLDINHAVPRELRINHEDMKRKPYLGRFTAQGMPGGSSFELRLICIHTYFGDDNNDRTLRQKELDILLQDVFPQVEDRPYQNGLIPYTVLLGDYNAELVVTKNMEAYRKIKKVREKEQPNKPLPYVMKTDIDGIVHSERYDSDIKTVQYELTTLKTKIDENKYEQYVDSGFASNYDHFSYNEKNIGSLVMTGKSQPRRLDVVRRGGYFSGNSPDSFRKYFKTISDHIPIVLELQIN